MSLAGKKLAVLGDSITEGVGVTDPDNMFYNRIFRSEGLRALCINGISGSRFAAQRNPTMFELRADRHFISRVDELDEDSDVVVVFGGTNDFGHGDAPLGSPEDRTQYTFCGACNLLCENLIRRFPDKLIVFMGPLHRTHEDDPCGTPGRKNGPVGTLYDYCGIIEATAKRFGIPYLDMLAVSGMTPLVSIQKEMYMPDGLHPNDAGHEKIAQRLAGFLKTLI